VTDLLVKYGGYDEDVVKSLQEGLNIPGLIARILCARGIRSPLEAKAFLYPTLGDLSDPFLIPDMEKGVLRTMKAIEEKERIGLFGDYDADGITSLALMENFLKQLGIAPLTWVPERKDGYGLSRHAVEVLKEKGVTLLICLDCGSSNVEEIGLANSLGVDTVVLDHHELSEEMPPAEALINPKREGSKFPTRELAACGVTFFFLMALRRFMMREGRLKEKINLKRELDVVAIGTLGDMVPLTKDNRIMTRFGMEMMRTQPRTWLKAFYKKNIISRGKIDEYALSFVITPRINAAGRVSKPEESLRFLVCDDETESERLLTVLHDANRERQQTEQAVLREAIGMVQNDNGHRNNAIVLFREGWHIGVIGIVAQKLMERYGKPSIVITEVDGLCKGSGRGGNGIDLYGAINSLSSFLVRFGGHKYACGISLLRENILPFSEAFEGSVKEFHAEKPREIYVDTVADFEELTKEAVDLIDGLTPFGVGNPRPNLLLTSSAISISDRKVRIVDRNNRPWQGHIPGQGPFPRGPYAGVVATPAVREQMGKKFIHLSVRELLPLKT
jgi:single-stranded-DNA-specific exonuclease